MSIIRVDDWPCGNEGRTNGPSHRWETLARFCDALQLPFCLGVMTGCLEAGDWEKILGHSPLIEVAYHGHLHTPTDGEKEEEVRAARRLLGTDAVFIPPVNAASQKAVDTLEAAGYRYICTGPETPAGLTTRYARLVPSKFYGTAMGYLDPSKGKAEGQVGGAWRQSDVAMPDLRAFDCLTLHIPWESLDDFQSLKRLGEVLKGTVYPWSTMFADRRYADPRIRPEVKALNVHRCQQMGYDWLLDAVDVRGLSVLDFGCSTYPLAAFLASRGASAWWADRNPQAREGQAGQAKRFDVTTRELADDSPEFDLIILSNSLQHNKDDGGAVLAGLVRRLRKGGHVYVSEKVTGLKSWWEAGRDDPCWVRNMVDHRALWASAGLKPCVRQHRETLGFFSYSWNLNSDLETGKWTLPTEAGQVCALLEKAS